MDVVLGGRPVTVVSGTVPESVVEGADDPGAMHVERALRLVRVAAAVIAVAAVLGFRSSLSTGVGALVSAVLILGGAAAINAFTWWTDRRGLLTLGAIGGQILDVAGSLALVMILDRALGGSAWMVLLLPIIMGGVRFGAAGTLLGWTLCCAGFLTLVMLDRINLPGDKAEAFGASIQRFAFLLALAVPVAALTQWLTQRWEHQRRLTEAAAARATRLALVEELARGLAGATEAELMARLARGVVRLGLPTATITRHQGERWATVAVVGEDCDLPEGRPPLPGPDETVVTCWEAEDDRTMLTSVSVALDMGSTSQALHGWTDVPVDDDLATALGLLGAHARVSLRGARMLAELQLQATQDPLTGLLNRRAFTDRIDRLSIQGAPAALLLLDIDHFKSINDGFGHPAGDKVLRVIAERLRGATDPVASRAGVWVARQGGDEFAVLLEGAGLEDVVEVAERIEAAMVEEIAIGPTVLTVSFSIGIADAAGSWEATDLIDAADEATYQAKSHGRARSCWAPVSVGGPPIADAESEKIDADRAGAPQEGLAVSR